MITEKQLLKTATENYWFKIIYRETVTVKKLVNKYIEKRDV